ncbi:MAG: flagellar motor protein MotD [Pseudomonadota bacterium]
MSRKHKHEEHMNHEAWAIPYGDLVTLLLALFVVMYAISSVNEGKFRAASASLSEAFKGVPRTAVPIQIGSIPVLSKGKERDVNLVEAERQEDGGAMTDSTGDALASQEMADQLNAALADLIESKVIVVRQTPFAIEVEIQTDLLFTSGKARLSTSAQAILIRLANVLKRFPNPIRVEGHTDDLPIRSVEFPSNWELSAARAATVVHLLMSAGVSPRRMSVVGLSEYRPLADNKDEKGRNRNRRVQLIIPAPPAGLPSIKPMLESAEGSTHDSNKSG